MSKFIKSFMVLFVILFQFTIFHADNQASVMDAPGAEIAGAAPYTGRLVVYVLEPNSRWFMFSGEHYHNGFLGFALDTTINVAYMDSLQLSVTWDAYEVGLYDIDPSNIMAIAAIFNDEWHQGYAVPPDTFPFDAYYVDAVAAATVDSQWSNASAGEYTHTVLLEVATTTYCWSCPLNSEMLYALYQSHDYSFFYIEMVADKIDAVMPWLDRYNCMFASTIFYDGGARVTVGSEEEEDYYLDPIEECGAREVYFLGLNANLSSLGGEAIQIDITVDNTLFANSSPSRPGPPVGTEAGLTEENYSYSICSSEPDGDELYYRFCWRDGDTTGWEGPHQSGDSCAIEHIWAEAGLFEVKAIARDGWMFESEWSEPLTVVIHDYVSGDASGDRNVNILDVTHIINYLYKSGPAPDPLGSGDANCSLTINILDVTHLINYLYKTGSAPCYPE